MMGKFLIVVLDIITFNNIRKESGSVARVALLDYVAVMVSLMTATATLLYFLTGVSEGLINVFILYFIVQIVYRLINY